MNEINVDERMYNLVLSSAISLVDVISNIALTQARVIEKLLDETVPEVPEVPELPAGLGKKKGGVTKNGK